jgi:hypothetical protein
MENDIYYNNKQEIDNYQPEEYPYKPDIIMGYQGHKICTFVLSEKDLTSDSQSADGVMLFKMRLLETAHKGGVKTFVVPVPKVVKYDLEHFKLDFNEEFNLVKEMKSQLGSLNSPK